jgi:hypothetical protein
MNIISHNIVKEKLKNLTGILDIPRFWGPLATILFTIAYHYGALIFGYTIAVGWLWLFIIVGGFVGGRWAAPICAAWGGIYSYYVSPADDWTLMVQRIFIGFLMAFFIGWLRERDEHKQNVIRAVLANGTMTKIREAMQLAAELKEKAYHQPDIYPTALEIEDRLGNTLAVTEGYRFLREEIEKVDAWYAKPGNVEKLRKIVEE